MLSDSFRLIRLARLFDAAFPLTSLFLGAAVVGHLNDHSLYLLIIVVVIFNSVAMIWNDIEDRQVDVDNGRPELAELSSVLLQRLKISIVLLVSAGLLLAWLVNITAFIFALMTLIVIWAYNSKPFQVSRRPIASIIVLSGAGAFLPYLFGLALGGIELYALVAGVFWWMGRVSLSVLKDYKDARGDARHNKKTFLLRYGAHKAALVSSTTLLVGYLGFIAVLYAVTGTDGFLLMLILSVGIFLYMRRPLFNSKATYGQLDGVFRKLAQYQLLLDVGVVLWVI